MPPRRPPPRPRNPDPEVASALFAWQTGPQQRVVQADQPEPAHCQDVHLPGLAGVLLDLLGGRVLRRVDADDFGERGEVERGAAGALLPAGREPHQVAGVVRHAQPVGDALDHVQARHLPAPVQDLGHPGLGHPDVRADAPLARAGCCTQRNTRPMSRARRASRTSAFSHAQSGSSIGVVAVVMLAPYR